MSLQTRRQLVVTACILGLVLLYSLVRRTGPVVAPTRWESDAAAGVRAMNAREFDTAERHFTSALNRALQTGSYPMRGTSYQNIGWLRLAQKRYAEARSAYLLALEELERDPATSPLQMSEVLSGLAIAEIGTSDYASAEQHCRAAIERNRSARHPGDPQVAQDWRNLAVILLAQGRGLEAANAATQASAAEPTTKPPSRSLGN